MRTIGIVGSEGKKFTAETEAKAREIIRGLIAEYDCVCSGECHLGGVDIYAREEAIKAGKKFIPCPPAALSWEIGYKPRNIKIAETSDETVCITVSKLPDSYKGMTFLKCYHCNSNDHVKSGGCWTTKYARKLGKPGRTIVI